MFDYDPFTCMYYMYIDYMWSVQLYVPLYR